jgi:radical SAM-linked protein
MGDLKFISHLDILRLMQRAVNRAGLPAKYSEGFNPHMKTSFGYPLSLGVESLGEYFELQLVEKVEINKLIADLNNVMPNKMKILNAVYYDGKESLMSLCKYAEYLINIESTKINIEELNKLLNIMINEGVIFIKEKKNKAKKKIVKKEINTKNLIHFAQAKTVNENKIIIEVVFKTSADGSMKASDFIKVLEENNIVVDYFTALKVESLNADLKPIIE